MNFFMAAARAAGMTLSAHIKAPAIKASPSRRTTRQTKVDADSANPAAPLNPVVVVSNLQQQLLAKFPTFDPTWDAETQKKWFDSFAVLMDRTKGA
jgi:hypothetical protein